MVTKPEFKDFFEKGYFIYKIKNLKLLEELKNKILFNSKNILNIKNNKEKFFDNFHNNINKEININKFRMNLMQQINDNNYGAVKGYQIFKDIINEIFGQDVVTQKNINLVIQMPNDESQTTVHRDAPPNSLYEIVVWLPLTSTYKTKNMFILDKLETSKIYSKIHKSIKTNKKSDEIMNQYFKNAFQNSNSHNLNYGEALIFWAPLVHCVKVNQEKETRWSINFRYKNTFSPYGTKDFIDYFKIADESIVTKLVLEKESKTNI